MRITTLTCLTALFLTLFLHSAPSGAQVDPSDIRHGFANGNGPAIATLFTVPSGSTLVLTDFTFSLSINAGDNFQADIFLRDNGQVVWRRYSRINTVADAYQIQPLEETWTQGITIKSNQILDMNLVSYAAGRSWSASWAGYLSTPPVGAVGDEEFAAPMAPPLAQNAPNPFNPSTRIDYEVTKRGQATIRVYDVGGRLVRTLIEGTVDPGSHAVTWDGRDDGGERLPSGTYFYELRQQDEVVGMGKATLIE